MEVRTRYSILMTGLEKNRKTGGGETKGTRGSKKYADTGGENGVSSNSRVRGVGTNGKEKTKKNADKIAGSTNYGEDKRLQ